MKQIRSSGFTLLEIAIVLVIVTILLGYTVAMVPVQQELKQYRQAEKEMTQIIDSLYAFAQVNGYLPCPATDSLVTPLVTSNGFECRDNGGAVDCLGSDPALHSCDLWFGYVPGKTLGSEGSYSLEGLLLDPWGMPYRYQVTSSNHATLGDVGKEDFIFLDEISNVKIENLSPDLVICNSDRSPGIQGANDINCTDPSKAIFGAIPGTPCTDPGKQCAPVVILSTGKDKQGDVAANSWIQRENLDNNTSDRVFVKTTFNHTAGSEFDDLVKWISPNILYSKMIEAGQLP